MNYELLQHLPYCVGAVGCKYLLEVRSDTIICQGAVTHHKVVRLLLCDCLDGLVIDVFIKAGSQEAVRHIKDLFAGNGGCLDFTGKIGRASCRERV